MGLFFANGGDKGRAKPRKGAFLMFTGIISHLGKVKAKSESRLLVACSKNVIKNLSIGASIALDGICLTVVKVNESSFEIDFIPETAGRTNLQFLKPNDLVNLELPATPDTFLAGHIVQGHIDGIGKLESIEKKGNSYILKFSVTEKLSKYIIVKGSIAVHGISLTVIDTGNDFFTVGIIPHTWNNTMLQTIKSGDLVNIEVDILAKYLEKLMKT